MAEDAATTDKHRRGGNDRRWFRLLHAVGAETRSKQAAAGKSTGKGGGGKGGAAQVAKSVGTGKVKREAALAKRRGISDSPKPDISQVDAGVQRSTDKVICWAHSRSTCRATEFTAQLWLLLTVLYPVRTTRALRRATRLRRGPRHSALKSSSFVCVCVCLDTQSLRDCLLKDNTKQDVWISCPRPQ